MTDLFISLFNMSITASWLVLAMLVLRFFLKKAPKWIYTLLWAFVAFRLVCPFSLESVFSLVPSTDTIPQNIVSGPSFDVNTGINAVDNQVNDYLGSHYFEGVTVPLNTGFTIVSIFALLWLLGMTALIIYSVISYVRIHRKVTESVLLNGNVYLCDHIDTPFILGLFKPRIFLPSGMAESDIEYVIAHETAHLRRRDHWWKPFGFALLTVYWFNPVMWLAYILLCKDIELACDEKVIKEMGTDIRKAYSEALINCSISRRTVSACPLAFGETGIKSRIKSVLSYKKPTIWIIIIAVISCIIVAVCFLTNPKSELKDSNPELDEAVSQAIFHINSQYDYHDECITEGHIIYGIEEKGNEVTVYLTENLTTFGFKNGYFMAKSGHQIPAVFTFEKTDNKYSLINYEYAKDGSEHVNSIKKMFPAEYEYRALTPTDEDYENMWNQCVSYAETYLREIGRDAEVRDYSDVERISLTDAGISVEISNMLYESLLPYDMDIGTFEEIEEGVRYIYRTAYEKEKNLLVLTREVYSTGAVTSRIEINTLTGDVISQNEYTYEVPETEYNGKYDGRFTEKYERLVYLDYVKVADEIRDEYSVTALHYPVSEDGSPSILIGEAYGYDVARFLDDVSWKQCSPPLSELSSPGSVEFVIDEDYRLTVYERKKGSVFAYALIKAGNFERYYRIGYDAYGTVVTLLHSPAEMSASSIAHSVNSYSYFSEYDSSYISLNPDTKDIFFSISRLSDYIVDGTYQDYEDKIVIVANDKAHHYTFRKQDENLVFVADESSPVPGYSYQSDSEPEVCIPDGAIFEYNSTEKMYIDKITDDIDNDGIKEDCILGYGPTSGLFTVTFTAYENGEPEYFNIFNCELRTVAFGWNEKGKAVVRGTVYRFGKDDFDDKEYDILIKDGNIVLTSGLEKMKYWGEQGTDSPYAPK